MKVLILTSKDVFYLLPMWREIFKQKPTCSFSLIAIKQGWELNKSKTHRLRQLNALLLVYMHYGIINTARKVLYKIYEKLFNIQLESKKIKKTCDKFKVSCQEIDRPSGVEFKQLIKAISPDIIFYQSHFKLDSDIINMVPFGVINRHPSLLPEYRGCFPVFWAKAYKDFENIGVTLFKMNNKYDTGDIIAQRRLNFRENQSIKQLYKSTYLSGAEMLIELLTKLERKSNINPQKQKNIGSYYGWPCLAQILEVLIRGKFFKQGKTNNQC